MIKIGIVSTIVIFVISNLINTQNIDFRFKTDINISNLSGSATGTRILGCFHFGEHAECKIKKNQFNRNYCILDKVRKS